MVYLEWVEERSRGREERSREREGGGMMTAEHLDKETEKIKDKVRNTYRY